ncbi:hypothetical protein Fmac_016873 [Flemingia macrophylla]|uniref:ADP-ribosyl cyclase/cyclic ADP-ribose hydrolase n=1 Tax=Flemingia macrophylla TaxID=520843 RepID=A0ABD1MKU9_9FABA
MGVWGHERWSLDLQWRREWFHGEMHQFQSHLSMELGSKKASQSNSSRSSSDRWAFHVFLSFRGEDTRKTFADHLYVALQQKGIKTFRDDEEIAKGEVISFQLPKAIEESLSYVVILSPNYASSTWCLNELQQILESRKKLGREVFPIFYGVDPSHVRHQKGSFEKAMTNHEERFGKDNEKIKGWRAALKEIATISGWVDTQYP